MTAAIVFKKAKTLNAVWNKDHPNRRRIIAGCLLILSAAWILWEARSVLKYTGKALRLLLR